MRKLAALVSFIVKELNFTAAENVSSFHVIDEYKPSGQFIDEGHTDICLYDQSYLAVIKIERFPVRHEAKTFLSLLSCWLMSNDSPRYRFKVNRAADKLIPLADPDINTEEESNETIAIEIIIPFREPVFGVRDDAGLFAVNGDRYRLATDSENQQFEQDYILGYDYDSADWHRRN